LQVVNVIVPNGSSDLSRPGSRARFSRSLRLLRHADFERVYKQGQRHFAAHMTVFYLRRAKGDTPRVGFTVGRVLGGAVDRNRMKRRLREAVRRNLPREIPMDVVINPKKSLLNAKFTQLLDEVSRAFAVIQKAAGKR
jgi:ribonuclease P protein component